MHDKETRSAGNVELRVSEGKPAKLVGYAAVFNSLSEDLGGFREIILPTAFNRAMSEAHDVRAFVNHDQGKIIGRTKAGTLNLEVDEHGLRVEIMPTDTQVGRDAIADVRAGNLDQMSFAFRAVTDRWRTEEGTAVRELEDLELLDVSLVAFPAYPATHVSARALEQAKSTVCHVLPDGVPAQVNEARLRLRG